MIPEDRELRDLMHVWQTETPGAVDPAVILRQVKRRSLGLKLLAGGEILLVAGALAGLILFAVRHPDPMDVAVMSTFCLLALGSLAFSFWNRRGQWSPATESTAAYLELARSRARRRHAALRFSRWLLAAETLLFLPWIWLTLRAGRLDLIRYATAYGFLALVVGTVAALIAWLERRTRRELAALGERGAMLSSRRPSSPR